MRHSESLNSDDSTGEMAGRKRASPTQASISVRTVRLLIDHWPPLAILGLSLFAFTWFDGPNLKAFWDVSPAYSPSYALSLRTYIWNPYINLGLPSAQLNTLPVYVLFDSAYLLSGGSVVLAEQLVWWAAFAGEGIFAYLWLSYGANPSERRRIAAFCGATFYMFNPYSAFLTWGDNAPLAGFALAALPAILYLTRRGVEGGRRPSPFYLGLTIGAVSPFVFVLYPLAPGCLLVLAIALLPYLFNQGTRSRLLKLGAVAVPLGVLTNLTWVATLGPLVSLGLSPAAGRSASSSVHGVNILSSCSPLSLTFRMLGDFPLCQAWMSPSWWTFANLYQSPASPIVIALMLVPVFAFGALLAPTAQRGPGRLRFAIVALAGILLSSGTNGIPVANAVYRTVLVSTPFGAAVNYPTSSWGFVAVVGYAYLLTGFFGDVFSNLERIDRRVPTSSPMRFHFISTVRASPVGSKTWTLLIAASFVTVALASSAPLTTGTVQTNIYNTNFQLPSYVTELADYLNSHSQGYSVLILPPKTNSLSGFNWSGGFLGYDPLDGLTTVNLVSYYGNLYGNSAEDTLFQIPGAGVAPPMFNSTEASETSYAALLNHFSIRYIVVRADARYYPGDTVNFSAPVSRAFLADNPEISLVATFGPDSVLEVNDSNSIVSSQQFLGTNFAYTKNLLPNYVTAGVQDDSPFPDAVGTVVVGPTYLELSSTINSSVPYSSFTNAIPLEMGVVGQPALVTVSDGPPNETLAVVGDGVHFTHAALIDSVGIGPATVSAYSFTGISVLNYIEFWNISGRVDLSGLFIAFNLSEPANLANASAILASGGSPEHLVVPWTLEMTFSQLGSQVDADFANLTDALQVLAKGNETTNITSPYVTADPEIVSHNGGSYSVVNGTLTISSVNSTGTVSVKNSLPLLLSLLRKSAIVIHASAMVGFRYYANDSASPISPAVTGMVLPTGDVIEIVTLTASQGNLTGIEISVPRFMIVQVYSIQMLSGVLSQLPPLQSSGQTLAVATLKVSQIEPTEWGGSVDFPEAGTYLITLQQQFANDWTIGFSSAQADRDASPSIQHLESSDGMNGFLLNVSSPLVTSLTIDLPFQATVEIITTISWASEVGAVALFSAVWVVTWRRHRKAP